MNDAVAYFRSALLFVSEWWERAVSSPWKNQWNDLVRLVSRFALNISHQNVPGSVRIRKSFYGET